MQRDIEQIKTTVAEMSRLVERALQDAVQALLRDDRRLAFSVILRDRLIDEKEQELDRMCLGFLVRQQPVAGPLRMAYAAIRISLELERMGDYAENIARQALRIAEIPVEAPRARYVEMADLTITMLRDAVKSFVTEDADLAERTIEVEDTVDNLKAVLGKDLVARYRDNQLGFETLNPLMQVNRRLERASDQARNVCHEVIYMCTGRPTRHRGGETVRVLFVDETNGPLSQMAEAIGRSLGKSSVVFESAGLEPRRLETQAIEFMRTKGVDLSRSPVRAIHEIPDLDQFQVVVALSDAVRKAFPRKPRGIVYLEWPHRMPSSAGGAGAPDAAAYEAAYARLRADVQDLVEMVDGE
ncbi:MAG: phosphate signaling complex protein PhoU [Acidobacteriota bacterium]